MPKRPPRYGSRSGTEKPPRLERKTACRRGYDRRWRQASRQFLAEHPLCAACAAQGRTTAAACVDHIIPHRGNRRLFWDRGNWQGLCTPCHSAKTARGQ